MRKNVELVFVGKIEMKVLLHADDMLLTLSELDGTLPCLMNVINNFGTISEYKVYWERSSASLLPRNTFRDHVERFWFL